MVKTVKWVALGLAGAVAFRVFMFLVPYVFVLVAFLGFAAGESNRPPTEVAADFGAAGLVASGVQNLADEPFSTRLVALIGGLVAGLLGVYNLASLLQQQGVLFEVRRFEPELYAAVTCGLSLLAIFAAWLPARRAAVIEPMVALRSE